jgi:hypothetical protein
MLETVETAKVRKSKSFGAKMFVGLGEALEHVIASPFSAIEMISGNQKTENHRVRDRYRDQYSYEETVVRPTKKMVTRFVEQITGFEEQREMVKRMIPEVVSRQERVGTVYLAGGTRVIEDVFALGIAAERAHGGEQEFSRRFADELVAARQEIQLQLAPLSPRIDSAAANPNAKEGERDIYEMLIKVFAT